MNKGYNHSCGLHSAPLATSLAFVDATSTHPSSLDKAPSILMAHAAATASTPPSCRPTKRSVALSLRKKHSCLGVGSNKQHGQF